MMTTIEPLLIEVSQLLGETTTDISTARIGMCNRAIRHTFEQYSWSFRRKPLALTTTVNVQEYDLTSALIVTDNDYDSEFGVYEIWNGTTKIEPIFPENKQNFSSADSYYLSPDNKKINFTLPQTSANTYTVYYYSRHVDVASKTTILKTYIPENFMVPICTYIRHLVHDRKRQRNDARNMILDFQEQISDLKMSQTKSKARGLKKNVSSPLQYVNFKRKYNF